jgi:hypothetical protein
MATASALDSTKVSSLQFGVIQTSGTASFRWPTRLVCDAPRSLQILLATVLLDYFTRRQCGIDFRLIAAARLGNRLWAAGIQTATRSMVLGKWRFF